MKANPIPSASARAASAARSLAPVRLIASAGHVAIDDETAARFFGPAAIESGERPFVIERSGPWGTVSRLVGLAVTAEWGPDYPGAGERARHVIAYVLHGDRTLARATAFGYAMEGEVSIGGRKSRAFTSSILFELPNGRFVDVAVLHVCVAREGYGCDRAANACAVKI